MKEVHKEFYIGFNSGHYSVVVRSKRSNGEEVTFRLTHKHGNCFSNTGIEVMTKDLTFAEVATASDVGAEHIQYHNCEHIRASQMLKNFEKCKTYIEKVWEVK